MSDDRVYVRFKGKTLGPLALQKIQDLARRGQITRMHDLSSDGMSWVKAEEFGGIFQSSRSSGSGAVATASAPIGPPSGVATAPQPIEAPDQGVQWYAHINGENRGPMNTAAITTAITNDQVTADTLVWRSGFDDWKPAAESFPQQFGQAPEGHLGSFGFKKGSSGASVRSVKVGDNDLFYELHRQRPWVLLIANLMLALGILSIIFWVVYMIVGAETTFGIPLSGSRKVITGLGGLTFSGTILFASVLLLRYDSSLKDIAIHRDENKPMEAARRLLLFWQFVGVAAMAVIGFFLVSLVIGFVMAAGAGAGVI